MISRLADELQKDSTRNVDLQTLMLRCRTDAQVIYAVCVGAGDAFISRYWPEMRREVNLGRLRLMVADRGPLQRLAEEKIQRAKQSRDEHAAAQLHNSYDELNQALLDGSAVRYVDLEDPNDLRWYHHVRADIVFVLVPDNYHVKVAREWVRRSTLVLVEKPYNRDLQEALDFETELETMMNHIGGDVPSTWVCPFDHYLAKIYKYAFFRERNQILTRIGPLTSVRFALLESGPIELWRVHSLRAGMIYDLFAHVLAVLSVELNLSTYSLDRHGQQVRVARHNPRPDDFEAESFAHFDISFKDYEGRQVKVSGSIGKGVGETDQKFLIFEGDSGTIRFDLDPKGSRNIFIKENYNDGGEKPIYEVGQGHSEFIHAVLSGQYVDMPVGGLTGKTAVEVLRIMNRIRERIPRSMHEYAVGSDLKDIIAKATPIR